MLLEEFDAEKYERTIRAEGREEGKEEGIKEGIERGMERGRAKVNRLGIMSAEAGRIDDFLKSLSDQTLQKRMFIEFGLEEAQDFAATEVEK